MKVILCWLSVVVCGLQVIETYAAIPTIEAGRRHSLAIKSDGTAWTWGDNTYGQLGIGSTTDRYEPIRVTSSSMGNITTIRGGVLHSMALSQAGTLWSWGSNDRGEQGDGSHYQRISPGLVSAFSANTISSFSAGGLFSLASKTDGTVWSWGKNFYGELGRGQPAFGSSSDQPSPGIIPGLSGVIYVAAGGDHGLALKSNGTVWAWGSNSRGQLGDGGTTNRVTPLQVIGLTGVVTAISASENNSLALRNDGTVWQWGNHNQSTGVLSDDPALTVPTQVGGLNGIIAITTGVTHSLALKSDGTVWAWGFNDSGQIGDGTTTRRLSPVQVIGLSSVTAIAAGEKHSLALKSGGSVMAWGSNYRGALGLSSATLSVSAPTQIPLYLSPPPPPVNDNFANRTAIGGASGTVNGTVAGATREAGEPSQQSISVWWKWTAPASGQVTLSTAGSNVPISVAVYSGIAVNTLTSLGTSTFQAQAGREYQVATYNNGSFGTVVLSWNLNTSPQADLSISASSTPSPAYSDNVISYSVMVTNSGPQTATNVRVTDTLPPNTAMDTATSSQCSLTSNTITCLLGTLAAEASTNITIALRPLVAPQTVNNTLSITSDVPDPNGANNSVSTSLSVLAGTNPDSGDVPTLPQWGAIILAVLLMGSAMRVQARNRG